MPIKCKTGKVGYRYRKIGGGKRQRIGGCMKRGKFVKVKEVTTYRGKRKLKTKRLR